METKPSHFPVGKLPSKLLHAVLSTLPPQDSRLVIGPRIGEDAAVLDTGDRYLVVATDPVTFAADRIGWYAVHVNANDVAVMGARPRWFFTVLLLPEGAATAEMVEAIMADIGNTCEALGISVCGGHTEITAHLDRPIVVGQMLGEVAKSKLVNKDRLSAGDQILLTRGIAIEGSAILAREKANLLRERLPDEVIARAARFLFEPGISVLAAALTASAAGELHAMHDPTEGGLVAGLFELAAPSELGLRVFGHRIPVFPETRAICDAFGIDPLRLIASGALLIGAPPSEVENVTAAVEAKGVSVSLIGEVRPKSEGIKIELGGTLADLALPDRDEIARVFEPEAS